ncbi:MAG: patatin-like phospholipase family protein [Planctomycetota bacterium]
MPALDVLVRYGVHLRVPLLGAIALCVLPALMRTQPLFANLFELTAAELFVVGIAAGLAGWTCVMTALLVLRLAPARYRLPGSAWFALDDAGRPRHRAFELSIALLLGSGGLVVAGRSEQPDPEAWDATATLACIGGVATGLAAVRLVERLVVLRLLAPRIGTPATEPDPSAPWWRAGYFAPGSWRPLAGHLPALAGLAVLALVYAWMATRAPEQVAVPVLAMLVFALALLVSALAGLAFFFDRFGLPLLLVIVAWTALGGAFTDSTHVFFVRPRAQAPQRATVAQALDQRRPEDHRVVVVCAEGGGIQAAAWTANVLVQLDRTIGDFHRRLALVSAVSGGSVGAMDYLAHFDPHAPLTQADGDAVLRAAKASSLVPVGWAMVFKDLRRALGMRFLIDASMDRSLALEASWRRALPPLQHATLGDWAERTARGELPPVVFNATFAGVGERPNKGKRLMLTTVDFGTTAAPRNERLHSFFDYYGRHAYPGIEPLRETFDVDVVTAARMSATFPYVTPLARAAAAGSHELIEGRKDYVADGGYFDNSGIATAMDWLLQALAHDPGLRVALVLVRSFPESLARQADPRIGAWANAVYGPLDLMLATRSSTQAVRADIEAQLVEREGRVRVFAMPFDTDTHIQPPLSWHLSRAQQAQIDAAWAYGGDRSPRAVAAKLAEWCAGH